jgi:asparagine synthase (glutamine-hydrolysing)
MDKLGFVTPEAVWMKDHDPEAFKAQIVRAIASSKGVLNESITDSVFPIIEGKKRYSFLPWKIISFGLWMDRFEVEL